MQNVDGTWKFWKREDFAALDTFYAQPSGEIGGKPSTGLAWCLHFIEGNPASITKEQALSSISAYLTKVTPHDSLDQDPTFQAIKKCLDTVTDPIALITSGQSRNIELAGQDYRKQALQM